MWDEAFCDDPLTTKVEIGNTNEVNTPSLISKSETVEQEMYVPPFVEGLKCIDQNVNSNGDTQIEIPMTSSGINSSDYQSEAQYYVLMTSNGFSNNIMPLDVIIKKPNTVPTVTISSPPMSPINMESQVKIKRKENIRRRNRVAASNYRRRKLELTAKQVYNIEVLKKKNTELTTELNKLLEQICQLKQTVDEHIQNGCQFETDRTINNDHN